MPLSGSQRSLLISADSILSAYRFPNRKQLPYYKHPSAICQELFSTLFQRNFPSQLPRPSDSGLPHHLNLNTLSYSESVVKKKIFGLEKYLKRSSQSDFFPARKLPIYILHFLTCQEKNSNLDFYFVIPLFSGS